jgi:hypothetical protein
VGVMRPKKDQAAWSPKTEDDAALSASCSSEEQVTLDGLDTPRSRCTLSADESVRMSVVQQSIKIGIAA